MCAICWKITYLLKMLRKTKKNLNLNNVFWKNINLAFSKTNFYVGELMALFVDWLNATSHCQWQKGKVFLHNDRLPCLIGDIEF